MMELKPMQRNPREYIDRKPPLLVNSLPTPLGCMIYMVMSGNGAPTLGMKTIKEHQHKGKFGMSRIRMIIVIKSIVLKI
jgi:hypothetical protein